MIKDNLKILLVIKKYIVMVQAIMGKLSDIFIGYENTI